MFEETCSTAASLSLPFFLKLACSAYEITRRTPPRFCGKGTFYCAQTPDGQYLEHVYATLTTTQDEIQKIETHIYGDGGLRDYGQGLGNAILRAGGSSGDCRRDAGVREVYARVGELQGEVQVLRAREEGMMVTIEKAKRWFAAAQARFGLGIGGPSSLSLPRGMYPPALQGNAVTSPPRQVSMSLYRPVPSKKRGPPKRDSLSPEEQPAPPLPTRRSSRVRTKKVRYAESESDPPSRTLSPEKSDAAESSFSLKTRTEILPQERVARSSSLVDMIEDWKKGQHEKETQDETFPTRSRVPTKTVDYTAQIRKLQATALPHFPPSPRKRVGEHSSDPQKRSLPQSAIQISSKCMTSSPRESARIMGAEIEGETPASKRTLGEVQYELREGAAAAAEEEVPLLEEDVASEGDSTLSEIDWDVLEEGVL